MCRSSWENEAVWLLGNYIERVWKIMSKGAQVIKEEEFFGFLRFKFRLDQSGARVAMSDIPGL